MFVSLEVLKKAKEGNPKAKAQVFKANVGLIWSCVKRYIGLLEREDLFQIGSIGLIKAIDRFDADYGTVFSTYAVPLILGEIRRYLRDNGAIKVSRRLKEISLAARRFSAKMKVQTGKEPSVKELAERLEIDVDLLCRALEATQPMLYFEDLSYTPNAVSNSLHIRSSSKQTFTESLDLKDAVSTLDETLKFIVIGRFFHGKTQREIANELNFSQAHISRLEKKALLILRQVLHLKKS